MSRTPQTELGQLFGRAVRARRLAMGLTQSELGRRIGAGKCLISDVESRTRGGVTLSMAERIATALETRASDLVREAEALRFIVHDVQEVERQAAE